MDERRSSLSSGMAPSQPYGYSQAKKEDTLSTEEFNPYKSVGVESPDGGQRRRARIDNNVTETGDVELRSVLYNPYHGQESAKNTLYSRSGR